MKKIISLVLVFGIIVAALAGCTGKNNSSVSKDDPEKAVTLVLAIPFARQQDSDLVQTEINKKLETLLPNTQVELMLDANMADKWPLWMSTQKSIDIAHSGYVTILENEILNKTYEPLNDLIDEYAPNIKKLSEDYWYSYDCVKFNGDLYAVPNIQYYINNANSIKILKAAAPFVDLKKLKDEAWSSDKTTEEFWNILYNGLENAVNNGVDCSSIASLTLINVAKRGYSFIGGENSSFCYDIKANDGKIIDFYKTDEYKYLCDFMKKAAAKGWVSKDILTGQWSDGLYGSMASHIKMDKETALIPTTENEASITLILDNPEQINVLTTKFGQNSSYYSIPFTSENPVRAIKFLDLINSEEGAEICNLLAYGIEGKHYEFVNKEEGDIKAFEYQAQGSASVSYGIPNWMVVNMMQGMYNIAPYTNEYKEYAKNYYLEELNKKEKHVLYGFNLDYDSIRTKLNQILKNNAEYSPSIYCGIVNNTDSIIKELDKKNESAGYNEVLAEMQKQADEFISSK